MAKPKQTISSLINSALKEAGYKGELSRAFLFIFYNTPPLNLNDKQKDRYIEQITSVPGISFDEGQGDGYEFEIDAEAFTLQSEKKLLSILKKYERFKL